MDSFSERRLVENELMFRSANRKVQKQMLAEPRPRSRAPETIKLRFYCECSNLDCRERIPLTADEYTEAGTGRKEFVVIPGHENTAVEVVVKRSAQYVVVEKNLDPAEVTAEY